MHILKANAAKEVFASGEYRLWWMGTFGRALRVVIVDKMW